MSSTEEDDKFFVLDLENEAVGFVDMHTPPTRKIAFERFRLANATIAVSVNALKKGVDAFCHSGVNRNDFAELFPSPVVPDFLHADNLRRTGLLWAECFFWPLIRLPRLGDKSLHLFVGMLMKVLSSIFPIALGLKKFS